jgi:hypothetical protein
MNDKAHVAHIIDIDSIVLTGADVRNPDQLRALIEGEVLRRLKGTGLRATTGLVNNEARVAGEVARTVVRSVRGVSNGV